MALKETGESSSAAKVRPAMLQIVDHRGNVVVVDGGSRFVGQIKQMPSSFNDGALVEVSLMLGSEAVHIRLAVVERCDCRPGAIGVVSVLGWVAGGRHFLPDDSRSVSVVPTVVPILVSVDAAARASPGDGIDFEGSHGPAAAGRGDFDIPVVTSPSSPPDISGLSGRLEQMSLIDTVQMLANSMRSGVINVQGLDGRGVRLQGTVALRRGQVCFAELDGTRGEEAFFRLVAIARGAFAVDFNAALPPPNIERETTFLLLDHLRQLDESSRIPGPALDELEAPEAVVVRPAMSVPSPPPVAIVVEVKRTSTPAPALPPRPAARMAPTMHEVTPAPLSPTKSTKARPTKKPLPERAEAEPRTGRFSRFFDELSPNTPSPESSRWRDEHAATAGPPPNVAADDVELPVTDARGFASLALRQQNPGALGPTFDAPDTDIIDRALISH